MEKSTTLNLKINPEIKENAEKILSQLGISMSCAVTMFLNQVILQVILIESILFPIELPQPPSKVNLDTMSHDELITKLEKSHNDFLNGKNKTITLEEFIKQRKDN